MCPNALFCVVRVCLHCASSCPCVSYTQVIAGKDKGTVAEIEKVLPTKGMVVVKGVNVKVRATALAQSSRAQTEYA